MATLSFDVLWRGSAATRGLQQLGNEAAAAHTKVSKLSGIGVVAIGTAIGGAALGAASKLAGLGAAAVKTGVQTAAGMETAKIGFTTMLGSATKADKFIRDLAAFAAKTPFDFPGLQQSASQLVAIGIKTKDVIPIMTTLGDITAGMGTGAEGIKRAVIAIQQMNAAGKIQAQDLNQLRDAGVPVYELLAKATGKSAKEVANLAAKGKLGKKDLDALMESLKSGKGLERFHGLMEKSAQSLSGLWSTMKDTFGQGMAQAIGPAVPLIKSAMKGISDAMAGVFSWAARNKGSLSALFQDAGQSLKTVGHLFGAVFGSLADSFKGSKVTFKNFADFISTHQADITSGFVTIAKAALMIGKGVLTTASVALRGFAWIMDAQTVLTAMFLQGMDQILQGAIFAFGWIPGIGPKLKGAEASFRAFSIGALTGMHKAADGARSAADGIDKKLLPALDAALHAIDATGKKEIVKAAARDAVKRAAIAVDGLGTSLGGAQIHLKKWSDRTHLSTTEQAALRFRLGNVTSSLADQLTKMQKAGVGQDKLTAAWKTGKQHLYNEFKQMGLSNEAARKLAARYAGIPPKHETKISAPGMRATQDSVDTLAHKIRGVNGKTVTVRVDYMGGNKITATSGGHTTTVHFRKAGGVLPGFTPGRDVHMFHSDTAGDVGLSGGEAIMRPEWTQAVGGEPAVDRMNAAARSGGAPAVRSMMGFADGGVYRNIRVNTGSHGSANVDSNYAKAVRFGVNAGAALAGAAGKAAAQAVAKAVAASGDIGGGGPASGAGGYGSGGSIAGFAKIANWVHHHLGIPYQFGGNMNPRGDCSSFTQHAMRAAGIHIPRIADAQWDHSHHIAKHSLIAGDLGFIHRGNYAHHVGLYMGGGRWAAEHHTGTRSSINRGDGWNGYGRVGRATRNPAHGGGAIHHIVGGSNRAIGRRMMDARFSDSNWPALNKLWTRESGWNTHARNRSSGAYGIPQSLPGSKMRSAGSDWRNNPRTQIKWGLGYIHSRYGNPKGAWAHSQRTGWYDDGGILHPGDTLVRNTTRQPERVLTPVQNRAFERMAYVGKGGGQSVNVTINASFPNYVGSKQELKRTLQDMGRNGDMRAILASAGR